MSDYVTADRADQVRAGDRIHLATPVLTDTTPVHDWRLVDSVFVGGVVSFTFDDESVLNVPVDRLVRIWRTEP